jgi:hypothetical protein
LEEYAVARALLDGNIDDAVDCLSYIFRVAQLAAEVRSPEVRSKAARIRRHALDVTQTVVLHPKFQKKNLIKLYDILQEQLETWTNDAEAWIGDRASGMKIYNLVAQYGPEEVLEPDEINELRQRGLLAEAEEKPETSKTSRSQKSKSILFQTKTITSSVKLTSKLDKEEELAKDQVYYLRTMKSVIDECRKPYYQRRALLDRVYEELRRLRNTSEEPILASLLLRGVSELMEYIAFDRTECETAFLAMSFSLKRPSDQYELDPLYGKKYETRQMVNPKEPKIPIVRTAYSNSLKPFCVPDYSRE